MKFGVWPGLNATTWADLLAVFKHADSTGWDSAWVADHFMPARPDNTGPVFESWTMLAALAPHTARVKLGVLVSGNTYRHPAVLAKMAANVDTISGGRLILSLGAAWQENEHAAYGIPFPSAGERLRRLDEACQLILQLFHNERSTFAGRYYQLQDAPLAPKPIQRPHPPLLVGGGGEKVTLRIAAKWADIWNTWGTPDHLKRKIDILERHCADVGRDPAEIEKSANAPLMLSDDVAASERLQTAFARLPGFAEAPPEQMLAGSVDQVAECVQRYISAGVEHLIIPLFTPPYPTELLDRFITEVAPRFRQ